MSKQVKKLQPEKTKIITAETPPVPTGLQTETQQQKTFLQLTANYKEFSRKRPQYIKYGLLSIFILPVVFLVLMFSLESKLFFLTLWIVSIIASAGFLIVVEYKDYWYRQLLGIDPPHEKAADTKESQALLAREQTMQEPTTDKKAENRSAVLHKSNALKQETAGPAIINQTGNKAAQAGGKEQNAAARPVGPESGEKPTETEDNKTV